MKKVFLLPVFFLATAFLFNAHSQTYQFSGWLASFNTIKTSKKTSIHFDAQLRSSDEIEKLQTILLRPGLNYHIASNKIATLGYALIANRVVLRNYDELVTEHRLWEQFIYTHKIKSFVITHRFRVEQRFIKKLTQAPTDFIYRDNIFAQRFRYFVRAIIPMTSIKPFSRGPFISVQNELFFNITNKAALNDHLFDQNRLLAGLGFRFRPQFDMELGFLQQKIKGRNANMVNQVFQVASYLRL
jgi:hypothetical protein